MKIIGVSTRIVDAGDRDWLFVRVDTDAGLVGWGEASLSWQTRAVAGAVEPGGASAIGWKRSVQSSPALV